MIAVHIGVEHHGLAALLQVTYHLLQAHHHHLGRHFGVAVVLYIYHQGQVETLPLDALQQVERLHRPVHVKPEEMVSPHRKFGGASPGIVRLPHPVFERCPFGSLDKHKRHTVFRHPGEIHRAVVCRHVDASHGITSAAHVAALEVGDTHRPHEQHRQNHEEHPHGPAYPPLQRYVPFLFHSPKVTKYPPYTQAQRCGAAIGPIGIIGPISPIGKRCPSSATTPAPLTQRHHRHPARCPSSATPHRLSQPIRPIGPIPARCEAAQRPTACRHPFALLALSPRAAKQRTAEATKWRARS